MMSDRLVKYINGGYSIEVLKDGTKIRTQISEDAPEFPETMDVAITGWCDAGCFWCHEKSTKRGKHGDIDAIIKLLEPLPEGVEIAIGGGDPMSHPEFERFVRTISDRGIIANVTINGRHLERHKGALERFIHDDVIKGVGISIFDSIPDWDYEHLVLHMIAGVDDPALLDEVSRKKVLILGYKTFGRGVKYKEKHADAVEERIGQWRRELFWLAKAHHLAFDTLAIEQLEPIRLFVNKDTYAKRFMGEEGQFSMYIDGVVQTYGLASYAQERREWSDIREMFRNVRGGVLK